MCDSPGLLVGYLLLQKVNYLSKIGLLLADLCTALFWGLICSLVFLLESGQTGTKECFVLVMRKEMF